MIRIYYLLNIWMIFCFIHSLLLKGSNSQERRQTLSKHNGCHSKLLHSVCWLETVIKSPISVVLRSDNYLAKHFLTATVKTMESNQKSTKIFEKCYWSLGSENRRMFHDLLLEVAVDASYTTHTLLFVLSALKLHDLEYSKNARS